MMPACELLHNSITIRKTCDDLDRLPGNAEADTIAHCEQNLKGEFRRTLTVVDISTGWTENASCRNNAFANCSRAQAPVESRLPFCIRSYDSDNGSKSVNRDLISWSHERDRIYGNPGSISDDRREEIERILCRTNTKPQVRTQKINLHIVSRPSNQQCFR